ncbi:MAG TPA: signal peptidase II [Pseudoclavibacter sp.]|nr:signal peptidase II [Pseudoclavibacter sp.]
MLLLLVAVAAIACGVDVLTKVAALSQLGDGSTVPVLGDLLVFRLVFNPGAAFSFAGGMTWVFSLIAATVVVVIIWYARRLRSWGWALALGLLLGGTSGNLLDRLLPKEGAPQGRPWGQGVVVDFIQVKYFAIFNMADVFISAAVVVFVLLILRGVNIDGSRTRAGTPSDTDGSSESE